MFNVNRIILAVLVLMLMLFFTSARAGTEAEVTGIHKAALEGDLAAVKTFLKTDPRLLDADGRHGKKPLHWAAQGGHLEIARFLLDRGAEVSSKNVADETPLHYAAARGHREVVELLLSKGAAINAKSQSGTPLSYAAERNHVEIFEFLMAKGADLTVGIENGFTLLHRCAWEGSKGIIDLLIRKGIPADAKADSGRTPLQIAAMGGNLEAAQVLIAKGADVNYKGKDDWSPLYLAVKGGHKNLVPFLLESGAVVDVKREKSRQTPLHLAAMNGFGELTALLLDKGADPNAKDAEGNTPLDYACRYGQKKAAKILLAKGAAGTENANAEKMKKNFGFSPLLQKEFKPGSALVWYLGHSGWAIKTATHLLIFDYYTEEAALPDTPLLANGTINPAEIKDLNVTVFVSHSHGDHYMPAIFDWKKDIKDITYVMGFKPEKQSDYLYLGPRETKAIAGLEITTIESNDSGVAFFVKADGVSIFHSGDHANRKQDFSGPFKKEIQFLAEKGLKPDIFFAPVSGCGFGDLEAVKKGVFYTVKTLAPQVVVPMHAGGGEERYAAFARETEKAGFDTPICCAGHRGDWFFFHQGSVKKATALVLKKGHDQKEKACKRKDKGEVTGSSL